MEELIKYFGGSRSRLARVLGVDNAYVTKYAKLGGLPAPMAIRVERMTEGKFKAVDLYYAKED